MTNGKLNAEKNILSSRLVNRISLPYNYSSTQPYCYSCNMDLVILHVTFYERPNFRYKIFMAKSWFFYVKRSLSWETEGSLCKIPFCILLYLSNKLLKLVICDWNTERFQSSFEFTLCDGASLLCIKCLESLVKRNDVAAIYINTDLPTDYTTIISWVRHELSLATRFCR